MRRLALWRLAAALVLVAAPALAHAERIRVPAGISLTAPTATPRRVLQLGDSHTAAMAAQGVPRVDLQRERGDGGAGFSMPWTGPRRGSATTGTSRGWRLIAFAGTRNRDPVVGLTGRAIEARGRGARAWLQVTGQRARVYLLKQPSGGSARVLLDGVAQAEHHLSSPEPAVEVLSIELDTTGTHRLEVVTLDSGPVRILGVAQEGASGLVYSTLGAPGARASWLTRVPENVLAAMLRHEEPDVIVLAFGTNEAVAPTFDNTRHRRALGEVVARMRRAIPTASLLLVAPPDADAARQDATSLERVAANIAAQGAAADANVLDLRAVMGGAGSIHVWRKSKLARPDLVHFTPAGYARLAAAIGAEVARRLTHPGSVPPPSPTQPLMTTAARPAPRHR